MLLCWWLQNGLKVVNLIQNLVVTRLLYHDLAGLIICKSVLDHVATLVDPIEAIDVQVVDIEQHQALVVQELLKSLQAELVQVVVNVHNVDLGYCVVL